MKIPVLVLKIAHSTLHQRSRGTHPISIIYGDRFSTQRLPHVLFDLIRLETRPQCLTEMT